MQKDTDENTGTGAEPPALPLQTEFGRVRDVQASDAARIIEMVGKLAQHHDDVAAISPDLLRRDVFGAAPWIYILVAETRDALIGYVALCGLSRLQFGQRGMDMHHLFIEDGWRGHGVGRSLVAASKIKAINLSCSYMTVSTHPDNHKAQAFYRALGFACSTPLPRFSLQLAA